VSGAFTLSLSLPSAELRDLAGVEVTSGSISIPAVPWDVSAVDLQARLKAALQPVGVTASVTSAATTSSITTSGSIREATVTNLRIDLAYLSADDEHSIGGSYRSSGGEAIHLRLPNELPRLHINSSATMGALEGTSARVTVSPVKGGPGSVRQFKKFLLTAASPSVPLVSEQQTIVCTSQTSVPPTGMYEEASADGYGTNGEPPSFKLTFRGYSTDLLWIHDYARTDDERRWLSVNRGRGIDRASARLSLEGALEAVTGIGAGGVTVQTDSPNGRLCPDGNSTDSVSTTITFHPTVSNWASGDLPALLVVSPSSNETIITGSDGYSNSGNITVVETERGSAPNVREVQVLSINLDADRLLTSAANIDSESGPYPSHSLHLRFGSQYSSTQSNSKYHQHSVTVPVDATELQMASAISALIGNEEGVTVTRSGTYTYRDYSPDDTTTTTLTAPVVYGGYSWTITYPDGFGPARMLQTVSSCAPLQPSFSGDLSSFNEGYSYNPRDSNTDWNGLSCGHTLTNRRVVTGFTGLSGTVSMSIDAPVPVTVSATVPSLVSSLQAAVRASHPLYSQATVTQHSLPDANVRAYVLDFSSTGQAVSGVSVSSSAVSVATPKCAVASNDVGNIVSYLEKPCHFPFTLNGRTYTDCTSSPSTAHLRQGLGLGSAKGVGSSICGSVYDPRAATIPSIESNFTVSMDTWGPCKPCSAAHWAADNYAKPSAYAQTSGISISPLSTQLRLVGPPSRVANAITGLVYLPSPGGLDFASVATGSIDQHRPLASDSLSVVTVAAPDSFLQEDALAASARLSLPAAVDLPVSVSLINQAPTITTGTTSTRINTPKDTTSTSKSAYVFEDSRT
jgi:hypothetical protein